MHLLKVPGSRTKSGLGSCSSKAWRVLWMCVAATKNSGKRVRVVAGTLTMACSLAGAAIAGQIACVRATAIEFGQCRPRGCRRASSCGALLDVKHMIMWEKYDHVFAFCVNQAEPSWPYSDWKEPSIRCMCRCSIELVHVIHSHAAWISSFAAGAYHERTCK